MATNPAHGDEMEVAPLPDHVSVQAQDLEKRLDDLKNQEVRRSLQEKGKSVTEIAGALLPFSFLEARNLLLIDKDPLLKTALANWKEKARLFSSRVDRWKCKIDNTRNEVYQSVGFFCVIQGVLLTVAARSGGVTGSRFSHESRLYLRLVSLAVSLLALFVITGKFMVIRDLRETLWIEEQSLKAVVRSRQELLRTGETYKFQDDTYKAIPRRHSFILWTEYGAMFVLVQIVWLFPVAVLSISR